MLNLLSGVSFLAFSLYFQALNFVIIGDWGDACGSKSTLA